MARGKKLKKDWFAVDTVSAARALLGKIIEYDGMQGIIVETESYTTDLASHARVEIPRSALMRQTYGHVYVYQTYGMYYCLNITTDKHAPGAVLIRAVEPREGIEKMMHNRKRKELHTLTNGPGKVCQAFGISAKISGTKVCEKIKLFEGLSVSPDSIVNSSRIGISADTHLQWRFSIKDNKFVS